MDSFRPLHAHPDARPPHHRSAPGLTGELQTRNLPVAEASGLGDEPGGPGAAVLTPDSRPPGTTC